MNDVLKCMLYFALIGFAFFIIGRVLPKELFSFEKFPFRSLPAEREGKIYQRIGVHKWKDSFPDMSRIFPFLIPSKKISKAITADRLELMIQETCIAEWVHGLLSVLGFGCIWVWKSMGGWLLAVLYAFGNLPYIIIQRYNRPRLVNLLRKMRKKEDGVEIKTYRYGKAKNKWSKKMTF